MDDGGLDGVADGLRDLLDDGDAVHLLDGGTLFNRGELLDRHRVVDAMLLSHLLAGLCHLGSGRRDNRLGGGNMNSLDSRNSGNTNGSRNTHGGHPVDLGIGFRVGVRLGLGLPLLEEDSGADGGGHRSAVSGDDVLALLLVGDVLVHHLLGLAQPLRPRGTRLALDGLGHDAAARLDLDGGGQSLDGVEEAGQSGDGLAANREGQGHRGARYQGREGLGVGRRGRDGGDIVVRSGCSLDKCCHQAEDGHLEIIWLMLSYTYLMQYLITFANMFN